MYAYIPSFLNLLPSPSPSHPSRLIQNPCLSFLSHIANSCWLSILHIFLIDPFYQYVNCELPDIQAGFRKSRGTRDQIVNIPQIIEKAREFQKNIYLYFIDYAKAFNCEDHNKLWKILKELGIPENLTCLLRNLYAGQEATFRTGHGTTDSFQIGKKSTLKLYIVTLLICRVHHEKLWAG